MQSNNKLIAFIGLFFLASISLHSFAHIDDNLIEAKPLIECLSCQNDIASDVEAFSFVTHAIQRELTSFVISKTYYPELKKPFNSQAPPKI
ncbi:MAG: hypothetical protein ABS21_00080 [SAR86 cluster bacterium BACL1 MAG-121105-bin34]|jgi:hypothetical protein|uniref:Cytochrome c-type biogenesis protein n=2 Tax=SAR86 cluster TaxID=62672 RepID=A0A0R2UCV4_9GAMM|nr:MAG: hypothetical protein ABR59_02235 [SAR86 cluster bacterium BACL1 MAG-120507-bin14]KRO40675.1 MAG: hypothetical protein ABR63_06430 [SAR86 cluster bacterium BACL1 MAG-120920-bin57]KRO94992.1 MAG: hypothetical protein ABS10_07760 [SAR86 cluster bacterium BACL1 MAG-120820-bin45]KRO98001.1 MAG: hypothetical protein ABS15_06160 [SAR86 cluster bacterium BACL1 MAG-120823-bin87]KRP01386.1 MAG: hypothetical protein ABS09_01475 [SAR86 cluster bacterium BACL1 MAG-120619-bin26]KRP01397.1 MAG: hypot